MLNRHTRIASAAVLALLSFAASAQNYVSGSVGISHNYDMDCVAGASCDRSANSTGKITFGHEFGSTPLWGGDFGGAVEIMGFRAAEAKAGFNNGNGNAALVAGSGYSTGLAAAYAMHLAYGDFAVKTRLGAAYTKGSVDYLAGGSDSNSSWVPYVGLGASYALTKNVNLDLDWDRLPTRFRDNTDKVNVNMLSLGATYKF
jgi:hypothetical protein